MKRTNGRHRRRRAVLAAVSTGGLFAMAGSGGAAPINANLVVNNGFENVNLASTGIYNAPQVLDWSGVAGFAYSHDGSSSSTGIVPNYADGGPLAGGGHWYFTSGNNPDITGPGQFFQSIDVSSGPTSAAIASGLATFRLSAFMSSYLNDTDFGNVHLDFLGAGGGSLGTALLSDSDFGPNNVWSENVLTGAVPTGTATVMMSLFGTRTAGGPSPDGYIDNVDFRIVPEPSAIGIAGGGLIALVLTRKRRRDGP